MIKAFTFGKFLPFHKGHEAMIKFALTECDFLSVLVCCSDKENINGEVRKKWIDSSFENCPNVDVRILKYKETELPNTSVSSREVSKIWSEKFKVLFPDYNCVVTSETYGDYVAQYMNIKHIQFDIDRNGFPVSASNIRENLFQNWQYLPDSVRLFFVKKVVILGTESTGKTTLTEQLAKHFNCISVNEAGRDIIANSNFFQFNDLYLVASEHAKRIDKAVSGQSPLVIIDTDIHITKSYSKFMFDRELIVNDRIYNSNKADLYLYLNNDVEYFQDGTRLDKTDRDLLELSHRNVLKQHKIDVVEIQGNWVQRFEKAVDVINDLIKND